MSDCRILLNDELEWIRKETVKAKFSQQVSSHVIY